MSESRLGQCEIARLCVTVDTKIKMIAPGALESSAIDESIAGSLDRFKTEVCVFPMYVFSERRAKFNIQINILYCHAPDVETPISVTGPALDYHFKKSHFKKVGRSLLRPL